MKVPCLLFSRSTWAYAISHYLINEILSGACHEPLILLLGTVRPQAENSATPGQGQKNSLAAHPGGSADPPAIQAANHAAVVTAQTAAVTRSRSQSAARQQATGCLVTSQAGRQGAAGPQPMRGPSTLPTALTHTEPTASSATIAVAGHLLQMARASATSSRLTAGAKVSALVLGSAPCIGLYIYQPLGRGWFQPLSSCVVVLT